MPVEKVRGGGEPFKYPWTLTSKLQQFPWKLQWKHGRGLRYYTYTCVALIPLFMFLTKQSYAPANVKQWDEIRAKRRHSPFDVPHDH
ncbi:uncharacterized protein LOC131958288 [Physella acuta]|uniref:uncharacterized protein LOC131958288 n=1 Tax=Physella acuta TaxID=109671 RepID=UPI0027DEA0C5|nr:uncharacterized protein LOC131958288 [Physella acuta]